MTIYTTKRYVLHEKVVKIECSSCGKECLDSYGHQEHASLRWCWGFGSTKDGAYGQAELCESCFDKMLTHLQQVLGQDKNMWQRMWEILGDDFLGDKDGCVIRSVVPTVAEVSERDLCSETLGDVYHELGSYRAKVNSLVVQTFVVPQLALWVKSCDALQITGTGATAQAANEQFTRHLVQELAVLREQQLTKSYQYKAIQKYEPLFEPLWPIDLHYHDEEGGYWIAGPRTVCQMETREPEGDLTELQYQASVLNTKSDWFKTRDAAIADLRWKLYSFLKRSQAALSEEEKMDRSDILNLMEIAPSGTKV